MVAVRRKSSGRFLFDKVKGISIINNMKVAKSKVKVMPCSLRHFPNGFVNKPPFFMYERCQEIEPIFNRTGRYYCRISKICWEENGGKAFLMSAKDFLCDFNLEHTPWVTDYEYNILENCMKSNETFKLLSEEGKNIASVNRYRRVWQRQNKLTKLQVRKRLLQIRKEKGLK